MSPKGKRLEDGSSPRVRGTDTPQRHRLYAPRFIPASAGNSMGSAVLRLRNAVHPRECGEQEPTTSHGPGVHGSSPRVRGTVLCDLAIAADVRFIPASAGNRSNASSSRSRRSVHPRECGEQVRGLAGLTRLMRFIPASAGNSLLVPAFHVVRPVHPRECGEQYVDTFN